MADRVGPGSSSIVENRPGAATNIVTEIVANSPVDGYTLLLTGVTDAINQSLYDNLSFNFDRDIAPVAVGCPPMQDKVRVRHSAL